MGTCQSESSFKQYERFFSRRFGVLLSERSEKMGNEIDEMRDEDYLRRFVRLIRLSMRQNRFYFEQLREIFERFSLQLPQKFVMVDNSCYQELKQLLKQFQIQYRGKEQQLIEMRREIEDLNGKIGLLQRTNQMRSESRVETKCEELQQIGRLNRMIQKHQRNEQNNIKIIGELRQRLQQVKLVEERNELLNRKYKETEKQIVSLKLKVEEIQMAKNKVQNQLIFLQSNQNQLNPETQSDLQRKQKELNAKLQQLKIKQDLLDRKQEKLQSEIEKLSQRLKEFHLQKSMIDQKSSNLNLFEDQLTAKYNQMLNQMQIFRQQSKSMKVTKNYICHQFSLTIKEKYPEPVVSVIKLSTDKSEQFQTQKGENGCVITVGENSNKDPIEFYRISDENKAEVSHILASKQILFNLYQGRFTSQTQQQLSQMRFSPWKGIFNKLVVDLGVAINSTYTMGVFCNQFSSQNKSLLDTIYL